jgi:predicted ATP-dependent endonuclease of OLD family
MRIESVRIQNFRGFKDETIVLNSYSCFVGPNGAGKSTTLAALNVFFRQYRDSLTDLSRLTADDFHHRDVREPIRITVTFSDLSSQAKLDLANYVRKDRLIVSAVATYDPNLRVAEVQQFGNRLGLEKFRRYFDEEKNGAKAPELQELYKNLQSEYSLQSFRKKI